MILTICKTIEFSASHILSRSDWDSKKNLAVFGKCANPNSHGHNYRLEVVVQGSLDPETSMIIDTRRLEQMVVELVTNDLDHKNLNLDVPWLKGLLPTTEVLVQEIWKRLEKTIQQEAPGARLHELRLWETPKLCATLTAR